MADQGTEFEAGTTGENKVTRKRGPELFTMIAGVLTLLVSAYVLTDGSSWLPIMDLRWVLAGGAILVGVLMLVASVVGGHRRKRTR